VVRSSRGRVDNSAGRGALLLALVAAALTAAPGCWTGHLIEAGRRHESVSVYSSAALEQEALRLDYEVEISNSRGEPLSTSNRSARVALADLAAQPEWPVDEIRVDKLSPSAGNRPPTEESSPIALGVGPPNSTLASLGSSNPSDQVLVIDESGGRHTGFSLCPPTGTECQGRFHSEALYRNHIAWWVYPVIPFTIVVDVALLPFQVVTVPIMIATGD